MSNLFSFGTTNGSSPRSGLVVGWDGNLYGTTFEGGAYGLGTIFQLSPSNTLKTLVSFSLANGAFPSGLIQTASNTLFGTTLDGGANLLGTVFKVTYSGRLTTLASFNYGSNNGVLPRAPVILAQDGFLYGTTSEGGIYGDGVVFRISTNGGTVSNLVSFSGANGAFPEAGLKQAGDGNLYGTTTGGGANGFGNLFELSGFRPTILQQPSSQDFTNHGTIHFTVQATGSAPLTYQWLFDRTNYIHDGTNVISGVTNVVRGSASNNLTVGHEILTLDAGSYSVIISNAIGAVTSSVVTLTIPSPTNTITSPVANSTESNVSLTFRGTAAVLNRVASNDVVTNVQCQFNGGTNWTSATTANHWTNWSTTNALVPGTNIFKAYSVDIMGNRSPTSSVTVFYLTRSPLTLMTNGFGKITRSFTGTNLVVGSNYVFTAVPNPRNLFSNWVISNWTGTISTANNPLRFLMVSNTTLTANFVTNSFLHATGTYNGLFSVAGGVGAQSSGLLKNLTVATNGAYSGKLFIGGTNYSVSGSFDLAGDASSQIARTNGLGPLSLAMHLNWSNTPPQITGTVQGTNGGAWTAELTNELAGSNLPSAEYTLLIPPGTNAPGTNFPSGYGYALITNHLGTVTVTTGALADGAAFSQSVAESENLHLPFYATPYTNGGLLLGWLDMSGGAPAGNLTWIRPAAASGLFTNGYTNVVTVQSSAWTDLGATTPAILLPYGGQLAVSGGFLTAPLYFKVVLSTNNALLEQGTNPTNSLTGSIAPKTGLLSITFGNGNGTNTSTGSGAAILQNLSVAEGFFTTKTNAGSIQLLPLPPLITPDR